MKKFLTCVSCFTLVMAGLFAHGQSESGNVNDKAAEPTVITITYAPGNMTSKMAASDAIKAFNASQDKYEFQQNLSLSSGAYLEILKTLKASGQMPDVFECRNVPTFLRSDMLYPLPQDLQDLFENNVSVYGKVYTAPLTAQPPHIMLYNKALFDKWGLNGNPQNYQEFLNLCEEIKSHGMAPITAGVADIWHIGFLFNYYFQQYVAHGDPNWISKVYSGEVKFNSPDMIKAMGLLQDLFVSGDVERGFMSTKESQLVSLLVGEKAAMVFTGPWTITQINEADPDFELGFFVLPDENGECIINGGASAQGWSITKEAAADPAKLAGFKAFTQYFFSHDVYTDYMKKISGFPTTKEKIVYESSPILSDILETYNSSEKCLSWNIGLGSNELPPSFRNWTYKKVQEMLMNQLTPEQLVKDMDAQWKVSTRDFDPTTLAQTN